MTDFAWHLVKETIDPDEPEKMFREVEKYRNFQFPANPGWFSRLPFSDN